ncbi:hypothetical protein [Paludisphaera borealis]|uniref:Uncharacterized protein n=1 Tax=Paludisphaera borealis TaxID=1387353 RepID=A0A1U7CQ19_9BACT|nr:hypothetical protein [Paludisphaera borealis]APW60996.1 hypothetical protein BSF38_02494 [Paludisphaera borealis]
MNLPTPSIGSAVRLIFFGAALSAVAEQGTPPRVSPRHVDYKVVFWYRRDRPIETFQYQVYDVRKGEYTPAVDDWTNMMRKKYPGYEVAGRDVDLARETGPNETRKVGAVIHRELLAAAASQGVFVGPLGTTPSGSGIRTYREPGFQVRPGPARVVLPYSPLGPSFNQNPLPQGFPVPMPYPRPHP